MVAVVLLSACLLTAPAAAWAAAPHVAETTDTDACAICHRGHSAASTITVEPSSGIGDPVNALIVGGFGGSSGDTELCFSCHNGLGSVYDTLADFEKSSGHVLAPDTSAYGPSPKGCNACHDSHGSARDTNGDTYPALLETVDASETVLHRGDEFCGACHVVRAGNVFPGMAVWEGTAHEQLFATTEGTGIACSGCHDSHGSDIAPSILEQMVPTGSTEATAVVANDRRMCYLCHTLARSTYGGRTDYSASTHGVSMVTVPVDAEWASALPEGSPAASRKVGECQTCHAAMGADDGTGSATARLTRSEGSELCYQCHGAAATVASDVESVYAPSSSGVTEIFAAYGATVDSPQFSLAHYYTRESATSTVLLPPRPVLESDVGPVAAGDIDSDGASEVLVTRVGTPEVSVIRRSALSGVTSLPGAVSILQEPSFVAVGDVLPDGLGYNEFVAAAGSTIVAYRWNGTSFQVAGSANTTYTVTGLAIGDVTGTSGAGGDEIVATTTGGVLADNRVVVITGGSGALVLDGSYQVGAQLPRGPSVENLDATGKDEIAFVLGNETLDVLRIWDGDGGQILATGSTTGNEPAQRAFIHDVLWGRAGEEVSVTFADPSAGARVDIFPRLGGGLDTPESLDLAVSHSNPAEMAAADVDGDSHDELVISLAGSLDDRVPAGLDIVQTNVDGTTVASFDFYQAAGVETADSYPGRAWVVAVELGDTGQSKHAVDAAPGVHVSTEADGFGRHVECNDCHNVHESTSTVATPPAAMGAIRGTWGVSVVAPPGEIQFVEKRGVDNEYELCLKCHDGGAWSSTSETRDIASEVDTRNASVHAVEAQSSTADVIPGSFVGAGSTWTNDSVLYCTMCHGNANGAEVAGPHASSEAPLLTAPYLGGSPADSSGLCYTCHRYDVYFTGAADTVSTTGSRFYSDQVPNYLHSAHVMDNGIGCAACHVSHGGSEPHLIRADVGYAHNSTSGGACRNGCHGGAEHTYVGR